MPRNPNKKSSKDLCTTQPPSQNTLPGGNTGLRLPAHPAGAFTISICWYLWLLLKFCSDFTTAHMHPPRPFVVKWRYAEVFLKLDP